jgi:hypothetical protein
MSLSTWIAALELEFRLKAASKVSESLKMLGARYDSSAYVSCRLFCRGVPVRISLKRD